MITEPSFTLGVEEEYLLVDDESGDLVDTAPPGMMEECERRLPSQVTPELLQCQIEVGTRIHTSMAEVRAELARLRHVVADVAAEHGLGLIAASTHPWASWRTQRYTQKERYHTLAASIQALAQRMIICGMHVHVAIEHRDLRIDLLGQASYTLPHLLALSTSSPFFEGHDTGLKSFRMAIYNELPRTGLPEQFESASEFERQVELLVATGLIEDSSKIWWDLRPSARFPTLEMRIPDVCTRLDDAICVAALYRCWLRMLYRLRRANQRWRRYSNFLVSQNRWLAMRHGMERGLIDFGRAEVVPYRELLEELIELLMPDAEHFGCVAEIQHARVIAERGTSADRQLAAYRDAKAAGRSDREALQAVVTLLREETLADA